MLKNGLVLCMLGCVCVLMERVAHDGLILVSGGKDILPYQVLPLSPIQEVPCA